MKFVTAKKVVGRHFRRCREASPRELEAWGVVREKLLARKKLMQARGRAIAKLQRQLKRVEGMRKGWKGKIMVKKA